MGNVFKVKHGLSQPSKNDLKEYELGYCTKDGRLYINSSFTTDPNESDSSNQANSIKIDISDILTYNADGTVKTVGIIPIENGGTGATSKEVALLNLEAASKAELDALNTGLNALTDGLNTLTETVSGKAPIDHASAATTYGVGNGSNYGHVKLSSSTSSTSGTDSGIAATPSAVRAVKNLFGGNKIITGSATIEYGPTSKDVTVSFGHTYKSPPVVLVSQVFDDANIIVKNNKITTTGFTAAVAGVFSTSGSRAFNWIAIGK